MFLFFTYFLNILHRLSSSLHAIYLLTFIYLCTIWRYIPTLGLYLETGSCFVIQADITPAIPLPRAGISLLCWNYTCVQPHPVKAFTLEEPIPGLPVRNRAQLAVPC